MYEGMLRLADNLRKCQLSREKKDEMREQHTKKSHVSDTDDWQFFSGSPLIAPGLCAQYRTLHLSLYRTPNYTPIFINDHAPNDPKQKYTYLENVVVPTL